MSILSALARAYDRLPDAPAYGFSAEKIGFVICLNEDGSVANVIDIRDGSGKKKMPKLLEVPQGVKRSSGIAPNFLWDKTAYVLGITAGEGKRTAQEHAAFVERHLTVLEGHSDAGLRALCLFLKNWTPEQFVSPTWPEEMRDQNVVFALESERLAGYLHDRPPARDIWIRLGAENAGQQVQCLISGEPGPLALLHPSIKGVWGAQTAGASIVSFNLDAFTSYGHEQGENAPVSEASAFKYTTALNFFLAKGSGHRLQIGDASTVFWAEAPQPDLARLAEQYFGAMVNGLDALSPEMEEQLAEAADVDRATAEKQSAKKIGDKLKQMKQGLPLAQIAPELADGVRFYVLALSPNAARLSVRLWLESDFGVLAENYRRYLDDLRLEPWPKNKTGPSIRSLALRTAPARRDAQGNVKYDGEAVSPLLTGELLRAILGDTRFPGALLGQLILRIRADHHLDRVRVALIKAVLVRNMRLDRTLPDNRETYLMRSDPDDPNPARRLGRLFALIERAQAAALGENLNVTVKDKYLGAACATPLQVFVPLLNAALTHHIKRLRNGHSDATWIKTPEQARAVGYGLQRDIERLGGGFNNYPAQHSIEEQGYFLIGYFQERSAGAAKSNEDDVPEAETLSDTEE